MLCFSRFGFCLRRCAERVVNDFFDVGKDADDLQSDSDVAVDDVRFDRVGQVFSYRRPFGFAFGRAGKFDLRIRYDLEFQFFRFDFGGDRHVSGFFVNFFGCSCWLLRVGQACGEDKCK